MYRDEVRRMVMAYARDDEDRITPEDVNRAIDDSVAKLSTDSPNLMVQDIEFTNGVANIPAYWVFDFSELIGIEHPIGSVPPTYLPQGSYGLYRSTTEYQIMVYNKVSGTLRVNYTVIHQLTDGHNSIPVQYIEPMAAFAASILCSQLAAFYSGSSDSTIAADTVDHGSRGDEFEKRAMNLRNRYFDALGVESKVSNPGSVFVDWKLSDLTNRAPMFPR